MLHFFRINNPYRLSGFLLIFIVMGLPFIIDRTGILSTELKAFVVGEAIAEGKMMYVQVYDNTPPLAAAVFGFMNLVFGRSLLSGHLIALLIIFLQASYFALFLMNAGAYKESTCLPALLFGTLCLFSFDLVALSAELLGAGIILIALKKIIDVLVSKKLRDEAVLSIGICIGLATFMVFSYWIFLAAMLLILVMIKPIGLRRVALLVFGFLLPHAFLMTLYYCWNEHNLLWENFYMGNLVSTGTASVPVEGLIVLGALAALYFLISLLILGQSMYLNKRQTNIMQSMFVWLGFAIAHIFLSSQITPSSLVILIPPISYFINHGLLLIKSKVLAEIMLWIFLVGILSVSLLSRYDKINTINYSALFPASTPYDTSVKNKKILILGEKEGLYRNNTLGGFFLNWSLSRPLFEEMLSYNHIEKIAWCFEIDPPEIIVDEQNLMQRIMHSIPQLKGKYRREGNLYRLN